MLPPPYVGDGGPLLGSCPVGAWVFDLGLGDVVEAESKGLPSCVNHGSDLKTIATGESEQLLGLVPQHDLLVRDSSPQ